MRFELAPITGDTVDPRPPPTPLDGAELVWCPPAVPGPPAVRFPRTPFDAERAPWLKVLLCTTLKVSLTRHKRV